MTNLLSKPHHGVPLINKTGVANHDFQLYLDELTEVLVNNLLGDRVVIPSYLVADLPDPTTQIGIIFVLDEVGGAVTAFSDLVNWRRTTDRTIVS